MTGTAFRDARSDADASVAVPMPDELRDEFIDAFWHTQAWRATSWLGVPVERPASDLVAYQAVVSQVRPDWIVATGARSGSLGWYLASLCDLLQHGTVVTVGAEEVPPDHDRIRRVDGRPLDTATVDAVHRLAGGGRALVVLGSLGDRQRTTAEFEAYQDLVPAGSYVIVEHTIVNGHPVWPEFGPGPLEAVKNLLKVHGDFAVDPTAEQQVMTFNRMGFLKRLR
jgi:cephalosporin hydroxylase